MKNGTIFVTPTVIKKKSPILLLQRSLHTVQFPSLLTIAQHSQPFYIYPIVEATVYFWYGTIEKSRGRTHFKQLLINQWEFNIIGWD